MKLSWEKIKITIFRKKIRMKTGLPSILIMKIRSFQSMNLNRKRRKRNLGMKKMRERWMMRNLNLICSNKSIILEEMVNFYIKVK